MKKTRETTEKQVEIGLIDEPEGVIRMEIDPQGIEELASSIKQMGQLQAILVRPKGERFEVVYGHRRFLACQKLGQARIRATVKELDDVTCALMRATENIERVDISPIEEGAVYVDLQDKLGLSVDGIAERMGKSAGIVKRRMDLLRMPPCLQKAVHKRQIGYSVAEELWSLGALPDIEYFLQFAVDHGATMTVVRQWVKDKKDERRREQSGTAGGGDRFAPMEMRPIYVPCDTCLEAMELGSERVLRICQKCVKIMVDALAAPK